MEKCNEIQSKDSNVTDINTDYEDEAINFNVSNKEKSETASNLDESETKNSIKKATILDENKATDLQENDKRITDNMDESKINDDKDEETYIHEDDNKLHITDKMKLKIKKVNVCNEGQTNNITAEAISLFNANMILKMNANMAQIQKQMKSGGDAVQNPMNEIKIIPNPYMGLIGSPMVVPSKVNIVAIPVMQTHAKPTVLHPKSKPNNVRNNDADTNSKGTKPIRKLLAK